MKEIKLHGKYAEGRVALIDDCMLDRVSCFTWSVVKDKNMFYMATNIRNAENTWKQVKMHQLVMGMPDSFTDHIDHNGFNNMLSNLRLATRSENGRNQIKQNRKTSSQYKGVHWCTTTRKWAAQIGLNGTRKNLGLFPPDHEHMAAMAYDLAAMEHFGEFANLNLSIYNQQ